MHPHKCQTPRMRVLQGKALENTTAPFELRTLSGVCSYCQLVHRGARKLDRQ
jgi:hypothetical protein